MLLHAQSCRSIHQAPPPPVTRCRQPAAAQPTSEPANPLVPVAVTGLLMLGAAAVIITGVQLTRRHRRR
jgi:hypothetical protein